MNPTPLGAIGDRLGRELERTAFRLRNGIKHITGLSAPEIGPTPRQEVWSRDRVRLYRYSPSEGAARRHRTPLLLVMSLVTTPLVFDLQRDKSLVQRFLEEGRDVFLLDWGVPDAVESSNTLEDYCDEYLPRAIETVVSLTGADQVDLFGYCLGGVLTILALAGHRELPVRGVILLATPIAMSDLGPLTALLKDSRVHPPDLLDETGNVPPSTIRESFRLVEPGGDVTTYLSLWNSLVDSGRLEAHEALVRWSNGHVPFPGATFLQIVERFVKDDCLVRGRIPLGTRTVDTSTIRGPVLSVTGARDKLIPAHATGPVSECLSAADLTTLEMPGGHAGLIVGRRAHADLIPAMLLWLNDLDDLAGE